MAKVPKVFNYYDYFSRYREIIPEFDKFLEYLKVPHQQYFRINTLKVDQAREELLLDILKSKGVRLEKVVEIPHFYKVINNEDISLGNLEEYSLGLLHSMTLSSALPVIALNPEPGDLVLDLCAAPGGKSALIAMTTEDRAITVANDKRIDRLTALSANMKRLGVTSVIITHYRGELFPLGISFDKVLVDAPCSGEGRYKVGLEGDILYQRGTGKSNLPSIQKGLLVRAYDMLKPGGFLVYSTCTINPEENEEVVDYLLRKRRAEILDWSCPLPYYPGLTEWQGKTFHPHIAKTKRFYSHQIRAVSFYIALIGKLY
ncbi:MAG: RsmB/NOP family class I SAM-dependent RNA methyltransferase [Caldimicrobium sp.]|nr:RsmB/NOP family class I SAM-dependent RNA methyltransferase [Caldimicrobium sp.]MCX7613266.1 RsmB/NOP family class I SAM-dependent RNA methyltransferase [Caldimicrobium sp.]MDW8182051.1 RsmB/NOP family class I SAM-dependent RNA methyltransferase [Caldimicrobium sp.]